MDSDISRGSGARGAGIGPSTRHLLLCALPLVVLIIALAVDQFSRQRSAYLADMARLTSDQHFATQTMLDTANNQLERMRLTMERALSEPPAGPGATPELQRVRVDIDDRSFEGAELRGAGDDATAGNIVGIPELTQDAPVERSIAAAGELVDMLRIEAEAGSNSYWSYFFSADADFIAIHPTATLAGLAASALASPPPADAQALVEYWLTYDVFELGSPEANPERQPYWTEVYRDAGGGGFMVSHGAPVYEGDSFRGIVATDILLSAFDTVLGHSAPSAGILTLINEQGQTLALNGAAFGGDRTGMASYLAESGIAARAAGLPAGDFVQVGSDWILSRPLTGSPFQLLYVLQESDLNAQLWPRFVSYIWILLGLAITVAVLLAYLHRNYVWPSVQLASYVAGQAEGNRSPLPRLPRIWRASLTTISAAFDLGRQAQQRLEDSEARFLAAASSLPDGFAIIDAAGKVVFYNQAFSQLVGALGSESLVIGIALDHIVDRDRLDRWRAGDGTDRLGTIWIDARVGPMPDGGMVIVLRDVTEAKTSELRIRESEARYRNVVNTQTELVARYTPSGKATFANEAYCRYMGMTSEEITSRDTSDFDYVVPEDRAHHDAHVAALSPEHPTNTVEFRSILPDGSRRWEEWTDTGIFDDAGNLIEIQAIGRDITDKRQAEAALRGSEARLAALLEYAPIAMMIADAQGRPVILNPQARMMLGRGDAVDDPKAIALGDAERSAIQRVLDRGEMLVAEESCPERDVYRESLAIRFPIHDAAGLVDGVGVFTLDLTAQKQAETQVRQQQEALHQSEKLAALGSLLAGVAHELNNPLSIVVGYAGMLHETATDPSTKRRAREVHVAAERCARIVKTFLAMARSKPAEKRSLSLTPLLDDVLELAAYGLRSNGVEILQDYADDLPDILGDPDQLHQVFMNLVVNAQQSMMQVDGPRRLYLTATARDGSVEVDIRDTGKGLTDAAQQRAFEPFFTTKPQGVGTGIGLSVSRGIVEAHEGTIALENHPLGGAVCRVTFPASRAVAVEVETGTQSSPALAGRVLIVDDEPAIAGLVAEALEGDGMVVTAVTSGRSAQDALLAQDFDAVITDLRMPDIGGERLLHFVEQRRPGLIGKVVVMTGDALGAATDLGPDVPVLEKPIDLDLLRQTLHAVTRHQPDAN